MCPLTVLLGVAREEVDALIAAGDSAPRTAQVWLQDAFLAPSKDDNALEPSGEELMRMQVLLTDAATALSKAQCAPNHFSPVQLGDLKSVRSCTPGFESCSAQSYLSGLTYSLK
jgi:hypothetical protein